MRHREAKKPQSFPMPVLDLRQKVVFTPQESESGLKYNLALVRNICLPTVFTGFHNDSISKDMQPLLLDPDTPDEALLEGLNIACATEAEKN